MFFEVPDRSGATAVEFMAGLRVPLANRVKIITDGDSAYFEAVEGNIGADSCDNSALQSDRERQLKQTTYVYPENEREFVVRERPDGSVIIAPSDLPVLGDPAIVQMESDGGFRVTFGGEEEFTDSFGDAVERACELLSERMDKIAKGRADIDRFFDQEEV